MPSSPSCKWRLGFSALQTYFINRNNEGCVGGTAEESIMSLFFLATGLEWNQDRDVLVFSGSLTLNHKLKPETD